MPWPSDSSGYLTITPAPGVAITARTYATSSTQQGTSGTGIAAIPISTTLIAGQAKTFAGIEDASPASVTANAPATYSTNLGLIETAGQTASVRVTMRYYFPAGQLTSGYTESAKDFTLSSNQFLLLPNAMSAIIDNARNSFGDLHNVQVEILVSGGNGSVLAFLQSIDNGTGDTVLRTDGSRTPRLRTRSFLTSMRRAMSAVTLVSHAPNCNARAIAAGSA